jgi:putative membrane protein insertion efficiency factor
MDKIAIFLIKLYRKLAKMLGKKPSCVFYPTCSEYSIGVFQKYGLFKGFYLSFRRILRCHPFQKNHIDPVP